MTMNNKPTSLSLTILILSLLLISPPSICNTNFQIFDVSNSLQQTRHIFTQSSTQQQNHHITTSPPPSLSLPLHSLSSAAAANNNNNYTSLTLSRLARDQSRLRHLLSKIQPKTKSKNPNLKFPVTSGYRQGTGEYLARIGVGRPAKQFYMAIDTGSDVSWLQCLPCVSCYTQSDPIFNPANSATYKPLPCTSRQCAALYSSACLRGNCLYQVSYGDGSYTVGNFATETISVGKQALTLAIGCGHDNQGLFVGSAGLLGLGGGSLSLPSQIKAASFSYCLVDRDSRSSSTLDFNSAAPADSVVAQMLKNPKIKTYLYVDLTGISVGGRAIPIRRGAFAIGRRGRGGVIVDSGTTVTRFPTAVYASLRGAFRNMTRELRRVGEFSILDTCYDLSGLNSVKVPTVSFRFGGGKTLPLRAENYLMPVDGRGKFCLAFAGTEESLSIIGNIQQQGTRVTFDLANKKIGFSPNKC